MYITATAIENDFKSRKKWINQIFVLIRRDEGEGDT